MQANQSLDGIKRIRILAKPLPEEGFCLIPAFLRKPELTELHVSDSSLGSDQQKLIQVGFRSRGVSLINARGSMKQIALRETGSNSLELVTNGFQSSPIPAARGACSQRLPCLRESWTEPHGFARSEEHTSELQSPCNLVCRLLLE